MKERNQRAALMLRIGLAGVWLYAAVAATLAPNNWIGFLPPFLRGLAPAALLLTGFSVYQFALALWLLSGWKVRYAAWLSAVTIAAIMALNLSILDVTFRDFAIFFAAVALAML